MNRKNSSVFSAKMFEGILCNSGRIGHSFQNEVPVERSVLPSLLITLIAILKAKWVQKCIIYIIA